MTAQESEPRGAPVQPTEPQDAAEERESFSYEGSKVPLFVILLWLVFLVGGIIYLVRWIPQSWRI